MILNDIVGRMKKLRHSVVFKSLFSIIFMLGVFSVIVITIGYRGFTESLLKQYSDGAFRIADTAAMLIEPDRMGEYDSQGEDTQQYQRVWTGFDRLCNSSGATFVYVIEPDTTDYEHIKFIFSTMAEWSGYTKYDYGYLRQTTNDDYKEKYRRLYEEGSQRELVIRDKGYIETDPHITAMIPLKGSDGQTKAILCVQRQMEALASARKNYVRSVIAVLLLSALVFLTGQALYLGRVLLSPVKKISNELGRFAKENTLGEKRLTDTIHNKDEIGMLADSIDSMEEQIVSYVDNITSITAEKERISTELTLASSIQMNMLPNDFTFFSEHTEFDIYASMDPARQVGGDFYDFFMTDDDHLCIVMADVSGKGIPAALFMMASKIILADFAKMGQTPAQILESTNETIAANNPENVFVTVWLGILELSTGRLTAANAGHEYPVLMHEGGSFELLKDKHGFVIGGMTGMKYKEYEVDLKPGSKLFLYTDGVPEATDVHENMFGTGRMLDALNEVTQSTPQQIIANVRRAVDDFVKTAEQFDDMTMLCLEYKG